MVTHGEPTLRLLRKNDPVSRFMCEDAPELRTFLRDWAFRNQREGFGSTYVLMGMLEAQESILGYYTLVPSEVAREEVIPEGRRRSVPRKIPVYRIGRLAVDQRARKQGHSKTLLLHALEQIVDLVRRSGGHLVVVDAKDAAAESFYKHFAFKEMDPSSTSYPKPMFLKCSTLVQAGAEPR